MNELLPNHGVIVIDNPEDYVLGGSTGIVHENRNSTRDWEQFLPNDERQSGRYFDTQGCVSFSANNSLECQLAWMLANGLLNPATIAFLKGDNRLGLSYLDDDGKPNLSDRFLVVGSNTTETGNSIQAVWMAVQNKGCVPERAWPNNLQTFRRTAYFATIPGEVKALGLDFLLHFRSLFEKVGYGDIPKALEHAPVHIAAGTCPPWGAGIVPVCTMSPNHATMLYRVNPDKTFADFDHYSPFRKVLAAGYDIPAAYKGILTPNLPSSTPFLFNKDMEVGETSRDVEFLNKRLGVVTDLPKLYGPETVRLLQKLMVRFNVGNLWEQYMWPAGRRAGPKVRAYLNSHQ